MKAVLGSQFPNLATNSRIRLWFTPANFRGQMQTAKC